MTDQTQLARLGLFDAKVPRYTSYPTAVHFQPGLQANQVQSWIKAIPAGSAISLYVHVPFCRRLCWFCACRTQGTKRDAPVRAYVEVLKQELALIARHLPEGVRLSRLHWGGGTPTLLSPDLITDLSSAIFQVLPLDQDGEFSVEIDPNELDCARMTALQAAGMTRASIGVQDFDPDIQDTIGRQQSFDLTKQAVDMIRDAGVTSLNADILYGLPHQSQRRITDSVQKLLALSPDRVALYGYAHVPWMAKRQQMIPSDTLPGPEDRLSLFETAAKLFEWDGYQAIGIDHFAKRGDSLALAANSGALRRNFQGYTDDQADVLLGLGASSISRFPQGYAQNAPATSAYQTAIDAGQLATSRGHVFRDSDLWRARAIEMLMCEFEIDTARLIKDLPAASAMIKAELAAVANQFAGFVVWKNGVLHIRPEGQPLTRMIARELDIYEQDPTRHSSAI